VTMAYLQKSSSTPKASVPALASIWHRRAVASDATPHPASTKEWGQLKSLQQRFGRHTVSLLLWSIDNWCTFSRLAEVAEGLPCRPSEPHIGFLLTHAHIAANEMFRCGLLPGPPSAEGQSTNDISNRWISLTTDAKHPYAKIPTRKEVEQFSKQRSQLGAALFDSVMRCVLSDWDAYTVHVMTECGETNVPSTPSAVFLLKHMTLAVGLLQKREAELHANEIRKAEETASEAEQRERIRQRAAMEREAKQRQIDQVYRPTPEEIAKDLAELE
jgi:hypothetical protein